MASAAAIPVNTYICHCDREAVVPQGDGLPHGWERKVVTGPDGIRTVVLCPNCADFERTLVKAEPVSSAPLHLTGSNLDQRTHDSTSAIDDEPISPLPFRRGGISPPDWSERLHGDGGGACQTMPKAKDWQVTGTFHTNKGTVEVGLTIGATHPQAAIAAVRFDPLMLPNLYCLTCIPAPLETAAPVLAERVDLEVAAV